MRKYFTLIVLLVILSGTHLLAQTVSLVKDINSSANNDGSSPSEIINFGAGKVIFRAFDPINGTELWISDHTTGGTTLLKDIQVGSSSSYPQSFVYVASLGVAFFTADDGVNGYELWKTDGTTAGTTLVADLNPGPDGSSPNGFTAFKTGVYFTAYDPSNGYELWGTDGTGAGTSLVADLYSGSSGSSPSNLTVIGASYLVFSAYTAATGYEIFSYSGSGAPTVLEGTAGAASTYPGELVYEPTIGYVYFRGYDATNSYQLWRSNGTAIQRVTTIAGYYPNNLTYLSGQGVYYQAGTAATGYELFRVNSGAPLLPALVAETNASTGSGNPYNMAAAGTYLYFVAYNGTTYDIYYTTSTGATKVTGTTSISPGYFTSAGSGTIYFSAYTASTGVELWKIVNGAVTGGPFANIASDASSVSSSYPYEIKANTASSIFFSADDGLKGSELWWTDGTIAPVNVKDINTASNSNIGNGYQGSTGFIFSANDGTHGSEPWKSDGTNANSTLIKDVQFGATGSNYSYLGKIGTTLFFFADDGTHGSELWKTDGTNGNTTLVMDINPGAGGSRVSTYSALVGTTLYFGAYHPTYGTELWKTDGTTTTLVSDANPGVSSGLYPYYPFAVLGTKIYYIGYDNTTGYELWKSDGTAAGTSIVVDINGTGSGFPNNIVVLGSNMYFQADDGTNGAEFWKSDGTSLGTVLVKDINTTGPSYPSGFYVAGTTIYFEANDGTNGVELWKSDGTGAGTGMVKNINTGVAQGSYPNNFTSGNNLVFFQAYTFANGYELWRTDGTDAGTVLVKDIYPGSNNSNPGYLTNIGGTIYFTAADASGNYLYKTNGTASGTIRATSAGVAYADPSPFLYGDMSRPYAAFNGKVFFTANTNLYGNEMFSILAEPTAQPTALVLSAPTTSTMSIGFTAASGSPSGYLIVRNAGSAPTGLPVDGAPYVAGATLPGGTGTVVANVATGATITDTGLSAGTTYFYAVFSYIYDATANVNIYRPYTPLSGSKSTLAATPSAQPTNFVVSNQTQTSFTVAYSGASVAPAGYIVLKKSGSTAPAETPVPGTTYAVGATIGTSTVAYVGTALTFNETGLVAGSSVSYAVFSYNGSGATINYLVTAPLTGTGGTIGSPPGLPGAVVFSNRTATGMTLTWTAGSGATGYVVVRKDASAPNPASVPVNGTTYAAGGALGNSTVAYSGTALTFDDTGLTTETDYFYVVYAYSGSGATSSYATAGTVVFDTYTLAIEPADQPSAIVTTETNFNAGTSTYTVAFTDAPSLPFGFIAIRKPGAAAPSDVPVDGTSYAVGDAIGTSTVAFVGFATPLEFTEVLTAGLYSYAIYSYNGTGITTNYNLVSPATGLFDGTAPSITNNTVTTINSGSGITFSVSASDAESGILVIYVDYHSVSSSSNWSTLTLALNGGSGKYEGSVTGGEVGELGIEYVVYGANASSVYTYLPDARVGVTYQNQTLPFSGFGTTVANYRIVSFPFVFSNNQVTSVLNSLGGVDKKKWRIFHYAGTTNQEVSTVDIGQGYWLLSADTKTITLPSGTTANAMTNQDFTLNLSSGWNQIGNPYLFNIKWDAIQTASGVSGLKLRTYNGTFNDGTILNKYEGGFVFTTSAITLKFPVTRDPAAGREVNTTTQPLMNAIDQSNWEVNFTINNGTTENHLAGFGMRQDASEANDQYDDFTLPRFMDYVEVNFNKRAIGTAFSRDVVPTANEYQWHFSVESNVTGNTSISWDNSYFGDTEQQLMLVDEVTGFAIDMRKTDHYQFNGSTARPFRVVYGSVAYVNEHALPPTISVSRLAPNPTSGAVTIGFTVPAGAATVPVKIKVVDLMGRIISTVFDGSLSPGYQEVTWNGADDQGQRPSQGVYIVHVSSYKDSNGHRLVIK